MTTPHSVRADIGGRCDVGCAPRFLAGRQWREPATARWIVLTGGCALCPVRRDTGRLGPGSWELQGRGQGFSPFHWTSGGESVAWVGAPPSAGNSLLFGRRNEGGLHSRLLVSTSRV